MSRPRDFFHTGLDVARSECALSRLNSMKVFGDTYVVDGTNGRDGGDGTINDPFATIQKAITVQTAESTGRGDLICVMPGVYAEALTGSLSKVSLIAVGGNWGTGPNAVVIYPTTTSPLYNITTNQVEISGFTMVAPSTTPAAHFANMRWTTFRNNALIGGTAGCITGLQVGNEDAAATAAAMDFCNIVDNYIGTVFGTSYQFQYGIKVGRVDYDAGCSVKKCHSTLMERNAIFAAVTGIYLGVYGGNANGTIIRNNYVTSWEGGADEGCSDCAIEAYAATNAMVCDNYAATAEAAAAIKGFSAGHVLNNFTSQNGVTKIETATA